MITLKIDYSMFNLANFIIDIVKGCCILPRFYKGGERKREKEREERIFVFCYIFKYENCEVGFERDVKEN